MRRADSADDRRFLRDLAEIAGELGAFPGYKKNAKHMLRVIENHRTAAYGKTNGYKALAVKPVPLDHGNCPDARLVELAKGAWDEALELGKKHGYRNAQATVIAPTGTIGLVMDCDTTGIEPDFALVKFKKLAGGGYFKIINRSVPAALEKLGYSSSQIEEIISYAVGHGTIGNAPGINHTSLIGHGFGPAQIEKIEAALPSAFDIRFVFNQWTLGEEFCKEHLGIPAEKLTDPSFDLLRHLGFSRKDIEAANDHVCGTMTLEGAPFLKEEHYSVFDCANACGKKGKRFLAVEQPHHDDGGGADRSSLARSPRRSTCRTTPRSRIARRPTSCRWSLGVKANALYRDGSKLSQPLAAALIEDDEEAEEILTNGSAQEKARVLAEKIVEKIIVKEIARGREKLPQRRKGYTQKAIVGGHKVYLRTGEYRRRQAGRDLHRHAQGRCRFPRDDEQLRHRGSVGLQYGVPLEEFVDAFTFTKFEPAGMVQGNETIKNATSILDYIFRELAVSYLDRTDLAHVKPEGDAFDDLGRGEEEGKRNFDEMYGDRGVEIAGGAAPDQLDRVSAQADAAGTACACRAAWAPSALDSATRSGRDLADAGAGRGQRPASPKPRWAMSAGQGRRTSMDARTKAKMQGYEGDPCGECGNYTLVRNGTCMKCNTCGGTSGCS